MKLYNEHNPAPNPRRVRIFLAEKGLSIPFVHVPLRQRAHKDPDFMTKNSLGQVPVLELDDGSTLSRALRSAAIWKSCIRRPHYSATMPGNAHRWKCGYAGSNSH